MEIRFANESDDKKALARLIYYVDPFIYPYWFNNNLDEAEKTLVELLKDKNSIYYYKNCIIAKEDDQIIGIFSFIPANFPKNKDYSKYDINFSSHHAINYYIFDVIDNLLPDDVCILGLFVEPKYRRKHVATKMFNFLFKNVFAKTFSLEVLAELSSSSAL